MAEPRRLGKAGAYRLGELRTETEPKPPHIPREASFREPRHVLAVAVVVAVTAVVIGFGAYLGAWFLPFAAGLAAGVLSRYVAPRACLAGVSVAVVAGWALPLGWQAVAGAPVSATARTIAALAGLPPHASAGLAATLLVALIQALAAYWLARSALAVLAFPAERRPRP